MKSEIEAQGRLSPSSSNSCAVFVTYHPRVDSLREHVRVIAAQVSAVVIVDNGSPTETQAALNHFKTELPRLSLILNPDNRGIATGLNQGMEWAAENGFAWALLMDQDSDPLPILFESIRSAYESDTNRDRIGALGANFEMRHIGSVNFEVATGSQLQDRRVIVTSGTLLRMAAFREVGRFRDSFFIDDVDHEYCLRMRRKGWRVAVTASALMRHNFGHAKAIRILGRPISYTNHPPIRRYYSARNKLTVAREYFFSSNAIWVLDQMRRLFQDVVMIVLFESNKQAKLKAMALGAWHFLRGREGMLPPGRLAQ